jgi:hypothetical protein
LFGAVQINAGVAMIKYQMRLSIGLAGANREDIVTPHDLGYDEDEWLSMSDDDRESILQEHLKEWAGNFIEYWIEEKTEQEDC